MYYHASSVKGIERLEPRISNHGIPLLYFSKKRENVLVYLSNVETILEEYENADRHPDYRHFPEGKFPDITRRGEKR